MERVLHIVGKWVGGGVEATIMNYYKNIDRNKIQFDFVIDKDSKYIPYEEIEKLGGKVFIISPYQKINKYRKELKQILTNNNYKIIHSHINTLSFIPLKIAKELNIPVRIEHSHSTTNKIEFKKNILKQILKNFSKKYSTHYFACSNYAAKFLFGNNITNNNKLYIMKNAIDKNKFSYNKKIRNEYRKKFNIDDDTLVIGHIGRFVKQKNHKFLINIFNEIVITNNNSLLILTGSGPLEEKIKKQVNKFSLENKVIFLGQRNDTNNLYQMFDLLLLPSLYEGLPVVGVEAQVASLPCILSNEITDEIKLTNLVKFISLNEKPSFWAKETIKKYKNTKRKILNIKTYDIEKESKKLENKYLEMVNNYENNNN